MKVLRMSLAIVVIFLALVVGFWLFQRHMVAMFARTNLAHMYRVPVTQVTIERVQELGFWRDKLNLLAPQSWNVDFTVPVDHNQIVIWCIRAALISPR